MADPLYAGFDVGGSKTVCLIGDETRILGRGVAGGGNPSVVGLDGLVRMIGEALASAVDAVGPARRLNARVDLAAAWLGVAGADVPPTIERIREAAASVLEPASVGVSSDAALILPAAGMTSGVALVAGTGTFATGVGPDGRTAIVGGWGDLFGDEGSGYELGRLALRAVSRAEDGRGVPTILTGMVLDELGLRTPRQLGDLLHPTPPASRIARLARLVLLAAETGDRVARALLNDAVVELATLVRACSRESGLVDETDRPLGRGPVGVMVAGGLASPGSPIVPALEAALAPARYRVRPLVVEPAEGALALARRGRGFL